MVASAAIFLVLGTVHLIYTFHGPKLRPRDPALQDRMDQVSPVLTRETTVWKAWIGFNASHSYGAMLFGLVYGYLAIAQTTLLFHSPFLLTVGLCFLGLFAVLGKKYWFSVPFRGILLSMGLFLASIAVYWA
jgi:hypothetical protein